MANLTIFFLRIKIEEYDRIKKDIKALADRIDIIDPALNQELKDIS